MRLTGIFVIGVATGILLPIYDFNQHVFNGKNLLAVVGCLTLWWGITSFRRTP